MRRIALPLALALATVTCGPSAEDQAAEAAAAAAAREDSLQTASMAAYDASVFDTLTWESPEERLERGSQVYNFSCARCHGPQGLGDAGFVRQGDTLRPPSFREPTWAMAGNIDAIRRAIFVGTAEGMPHWGLEGLKPEAVDAVAAYIVADMGNQG